MPHVFKEPKRPKPWRQYRWQVRNPLVVPFLYLQWLSEWAAWFLGRSVFLEVLEYCGTLSILVGVIFYFAGTRDRREQRHYQAWQVINTAEGKGGNGGRIDALQDLNADGIPLVAVDLSGGAYLQNLSLPGANLSRANISAGDLRGANLHGVDLEYASLNETNFRGADLGVVNLNNADLTDADLNGASLVGSDLSGVILNKADLRNADLSNMANWKAIQSITLANILDCKNAPDGFKEWALASGAVEIASDQEWGQRIRVAATQPAR
jgi:Pentapeptide repeats (8 copies)